MKVWLLAALVALAGCAGPWTKSGAGPDELEVAKKDCQRLSETSFPVRMITIGGRYVPSKSLCQPSSSGQSCSNTPGSYTPETVEDTNRTNRDAAFNRCMVAKGWSN